jgi:cyanate permease
MAMLGVPHGVIFPLALSLVASSAHEGHLAAANAGMFATVSLVSAITPALLGAVAATSGYHLMIAAVLAPVLVFSALFLTQWMKAPRYRG